LKDVLLIEPQSDSLECEAFKLFQPQLSAKARASAQDGRSKVRKEVPSLRSDTCFLDYKEADHADDQPGVALSSLHGSGSGPTEGVETSRKPYSDTIPWEGSQD
jgi:hypothetical protein